MKYHDPFNRWSTSSFNMTFDQSRPNAESIKTTVKFKNAGNYFQIIQMKDGREIQRSISDNKCSFDVNGSTEVSQEDVKKYRLSCDQIKRIRDYYVYLYGLPMKLTDEGTLVDQNVKINTFQGQDYLELKVTYNESVGKDTWYFYFNQDNYALSGYKFYHDEAINDGEYITLEGIFETNDIKIPKLRKWYVNKDNKFLGADDLISVSNID